MSEIRAVIATASAAFLVWMTVQIINRPDRREWIQRLLRPYLLKMLVVYFVVSALTLPFKDRFWLGEIPLLPLIQIPKVALAHWCQSELVMRGMTIGGLSSGSMSPDLIASRPWGLLLAYLFFLTPVFVVVWYRTRMTSPYGRTAGMLAAAAIVDFIATLQLAGGPGLSFY